MSDIPMELRDQVRQVLAQMSVVAESPASNLHQGRSSAGKPGWREPRGDGADLFTFWAQRFAEVTDVGRLRTLLLLAHRAIEERRSRMPTHESPERPGEREDEYEQEERILDWFAGVPALEAAAMESASGAFCPVSFIRKVRRKNDCDPETGQPVEPPEGRIRRARILAAGGYPQRRIAREMGVSQATVSRLLAADRQKAAA